MSKVGIDALQGVVSESEEWRQVRLRPWIRSPGGRRRPGQPEQIREGLFGLAGLIEHPGIGMFVDDDVLCDDRGAVSPGALGLAPPDPPLFALLPAPSSLAAEVFQVARASHLEVRDLVGHDPQGALVDPTQDLRDRRLGDPEVVRDRLLPPALLGQGEDLVLALPNHAPRLGAALPPTGGPARWARRFVRAVTHRILRSPAVERAGAARAGR